MIREALVAIAIAAALTLALTGPASADPISTELMVTMVEVQQWAFGSCLLLEGEDRSACQGYSSPMWDDVRRVVSANPDNQAMRIATELCEALVRGLDIPKWKYVGRILQCVAAGYPHLVEVPG